MENVDSYFKDHVAKLENASFEILTFKKPDTTVGQLVYFLHQGTLTVTGDWYPAMYYFNFKATLQWISECNFGYFMEKMIASRVGADGKVWSEECAKKAIAKFLADKEIDDGQKKIVKRSIEYCYSKDEWTRFLEQEAAGIFDLESFGFLANMGMTYDHCFYYHYSGLKLAIKRIKETQDGQGTVKG